MKKWISLFVLSLILTAPAFAGDDMQCPMMKGGVSATLKEASAALKASNPDLSARLDKIAEDCMKSGDKIA